MNLGFLRAEHEKPTRNRLGFLVFLVLSLIFRADLARASATLSTLTGKVSFRQSKSDNRSWKPAVLGQSLNGGDMVRTDPGSRATVTFEDGSRIEVGPNGSFAIQEATAQSSFMVLGLGSLKAWVTKGLNKQFKIRTPTAVCSVRGTEFGVDVNAQGHTAVQMFTGLLAVSDQAGNEVLLKDNQHINVTDKGLGEVAAAGSEQTGKERAKEAMKREVGLEMTKDQVQAAAAIEAKNAIYQEGKAIIDVNGNRVRIEEYIVRPGDNQFKLVVLNDRADRFDYFYYKGIFNTTLPNDLSVALRMLPGCVGGACPYFLTGYETARSNTIDNMLEIAAGGHQVDVNNNTFAADAVTAAYDAKTDTFVSIPVLAPGTNNPALNTPFFKTLYNTNTLSFNGTTHSSWAPSANAPGGVIRNMNDGAAGDITFNSVTTLQSPPACGPPNCTYTEAGVLHQVVYLSNGAGTVWEKYDNYIISDEGKVASLSDFSGATTGTAYKATLLKWNFQTIVTASEFSGRKIDLAVSPKIFIESGLIQ